MRAHGFHSCNLGSSPSARSQLRRILFVAVKNVVVESERECVRATRMSVPPRVPVKVREMLVAKAGYPPESHRDGNLFNSQAFRPVVAMTLDGKKEMYLNRKFWVQRPKEEYGFLWPWPATQEQLDEYEQTGRLQPEFNEDMKKYLDWMIETDQKDASGMRAHGRRQAGRKVGKVCTRRRCYNESCPKTGKLRKPDLLRRKWNYDRKHKRQLYHIVPLKKHNIGKRAMASNPKLLQWRRAVAAARARLGIRGFALIKKGTALYRMAKSIYRKDDGGGAQPAGARPASSRASKGVLPSHLRDFQVDLPVKRSRPPKAPLPRRSGRSNQGKLPARYLD